jgi:hypothetical protein
MDTTLEIRKESEVDVIREGNPINQSQPLCSNGCKIGTLLFAGSMIIIAGIIVGISVGLAK